MDYKSLSKIGYFLPVQLCYLVIFGLAGIGKFTSFQANVDYFTTKFSNTFLVSLPGGMAPHVAAIGAVEVLIFVFMLIALIKGEFLPNHKIRIFTRLALLLSSLMFVALGFGMRLAQDYAGAASLFYYFALTQLLFIVLSRLDDRQLNFDEV